ncbi:hypothetical protein BC830DRAFT_1171520, partial [Chytriomyces sp. MP71]
MGSRKRSLSASSDQRARRDGTRQRLSAHAPNTMWALLGVFASATVALVVATHLAFALPQPVMDLAAPAFSEGAARAHVEALASAIGLRKLDAMER